MHNAIAKLSEKEKQTLRLLVAGYDAKSMARHLGLSVHTINERLRDARRKLAVSSSREAARILRCAEAEIPENLGHEFLRDVDLPGGGLAKSTPAAMPRRLHRVGWVTGVSLMSASLVLAAAASLGSFSEVPTTQPANRTATVIESESVKAARAWLALLDAAEWVRSWEGTTRSFQAANSAERWAEVAARTQRPLGSIQRHELASDEFVPAPPMGYQLVKFRSHYANKAETLVTLTLEREGGSWKVSGIMLD